MPDGDAGRRRVGHHHRDHHRQHPGLRARGGLLHRDVEPANIIHTNVDGEGEQRILLTDVGIARERDDVSGLTATNFVVSTAAASAQAG